jgi:hypothetical protein
MALFDFLDGVHEVIHVQEGLTMRRRARVDATGEVTLVDALNLVSLITAARALARKHG